MSVNLKEKVLELSRVGHLESDSKEAKVRKSFLIFLALFMSGGGLLWGTIALSYGLVAQSLVPYAYVVVTAANLYYFFKRKNFQNVRAIQLFFSLILPFLFQWSLGGFFSSGVIMLWALLALVASPAFQSVKSSVVWLILFVSLTIISAVFDEYFFSIKPEILANQSVLFITINAAVIGGIIFFLVVYFVQRSNLAQTEIQKMYTDLNIQQDQISQQNETLEAAIVETNEIITEAVKTGDFDIRMNTDDKEGEWKNLAQSINNLFDAIVSPLNIVRDIADKMSQGNLTLRYNEDANGQLLLLKNSLNDSLNEFSLLLKDIRNQTDDIGSSLHVMQESSQEMNNGTTEINTAVNEISQGASSQLAKVDEASHLISLIAESAKGIDGQAKTITDKAMEGMKKSDKAIEKVNELLAVVDNNLEYSTQLLDNCKVLQQEAGHITRFTQVISEIASQTNLLSLNAGIQAADAGEYGKGFAVVAEEIRLLADRARGSVQEIDNLIKGMQEKVDDTEKTVQLVNESIKRNKKFTNQIRHDFANLVTNMQGVMSESETISDATSKQNHDLSEIVKLTENIVAIAEETATSSEVASDSSTGLANGMKNYMEKNEIIFKMSKELHDKTKKFLLQESVS